MTPEETQLLSALVERVRATQLLHTDADAEHMIRDLTLAKPEAAYILAQTVVMQDYALRQARAKLDDLQRQLSSAQAVAAQQAQAPRSGGFFSSLFGGGAAAAPPPPAGPWGGRPAAASYAQQGYAPPPPPPNYGAQPGYAQPGYAQYPAGGQPSFLQGAAQTAMGVAGGALLFEGVESLFGGHHGFGGGGYGGGFGDAAWGNGMPQETVNETVNNYYDGTAPSDSGYASSDYAAPDQSGFLDTSYDPGSDFDTGGFSDDDSSFT